MLHPSPHRTFGLVILTTAAAIACNADDADHLVASEHGMLFANAVSADAPVGYWKLAERSGKVAADSSGKGNHGTYAGGVALAQSGALADSTDSAALFDGVSGRVEIPDAAALRLDGSFSIELFAKSSGVVVDRWPGILRKGDANGTGYLVYYDQAQRPVFKRAGFDGCRVSRNGKLSTSRYKHYVLTYDAATRTPRWYVNGVLDTTCAPASYPTNTDGSLLTIGRGDVYGKTYLDEIAFFGGALDAARVQAHYKSAADATETPPSTEVPELVVTDSGAPDVSSGTTSAARYGYSSHVLWQSDRDAYADFAMNGGATTIRDDVGWAWIETSKGSFNWTEADALVTYCAKRDLHLFMMVGTAPAWASGHSESQWYLPANASDYGNFVQALAKRYGSSGTFWSANPALPKVPIAGIEIWNEPNLPVFSQGGADPVKYSAMLKDAYAKIKAVDPSITVVAGALAPAGGYNDADCNGVADGGKRSDGAMAGINFLSAMYANGVAGSFDAVSYHPYNFWSGATATEMLAYHVCSAWSQVADTNPSVRSLMIANGDSAKKVWATEAGAPTCIAGATYPCVSEAEQANLATQVMAAWKARPYSGNFYWYDLRDDRGGDATNDMEEHFGTVRANGSLKPSYAALKAAWAP